MKSPATAPSRVRLEVDLAALESNFRKIRAAVAPLGAIAVLKADEITHPAGSLLSIVSGILSLVAGISLIVGGIGIMNIMLVSVTERTHEIGIRKAIGATSGNIRFQFLIEALILSVIGGLMGLLLGYLLSFLLCLITPFNPFISWQILAITFGVSVLVGLIFGLYPAMKAAHKNPIYSLKFWA